MYSLKDLQNLKALELKKLVKELEIDDKDINDKNSLFFKILDVQARANGKLFAEGVIEVHSEGYGFLRFQEYAYLTSPEDIYVSPSQVNKFDLRTGDTVSGSVRPPKTGEKYFALLTVEAVNNEDPESVTEKRRNVRFEKLTPLYPNEKINLETAAGQHVRPGDEPAHPHRQGAARPDRRRSAHRQDHDPAEHRQIHRGQPPGDHPHRPADRRTARRKSPT